MKIIVISFGLTITIRMCGRSLLNLAPETTIDLLYRFPSVICMLYDGYGFANLTFYSIWVLITLRALFNAYPNLMFLLDDYHLTLLFWIVNVIHQTDGFVFFYQQSNTMCDKNAIEGIRVSLNLHIDESKIGTYGGISTFGKLFLLMPLFAEILSRVVIKWRVYKRKISVRRNNIIVPARQIEVENKDVIIIVHDLGVDTGTSEVNKKLNTEDIFDNESEIKSSSNEDVISMKQVIFDAWKSPRESAVPSQVSISAVDLKDTELDLVSVDSRESTHSLQKANYERDVKAVESNKFVSQPMKVNDFKVGNAGNNNISLGLVGFKILLVLFLFFSIAKIITATGLSGDYKDQIEYCIILFLFKMGRLVESMLPLYWLLRKKDTRKFAVRKLKYWKDFLV